MGLTLQLRQLPAVPLEAEVLTPGHLAGLGRSEIEQLEVWHGNETAQLADFFAVAGSGGDDVRVEGDLRRVKLLGAGMTGGRLVVCGPVGMHVGARMRAGELIVDGDAGDWAGAEMLGGRLVIRGSAGRGLGGAYPGNRSGMCGGEILVHGDADDDAGAALRRGLIAIGGRAGKHAGWRMLAGTIVAFGGVGARPGAAMRRGSIVSMVPVTPLPTFAFSCSYRPPFLGLCLRHLRTLGLPVSREQLEGTYSRWSGDALELRRGELLILDGAS